MHKRDWCVALHEVSAMGNGGRFTRVKLRLRSVGSTGFRHFLVAVPLPFIGACNPEENAEFAEETAPVAPPCAHAWASQWCGRRCRSRTC